MLDGLTGLPNRRAWGGALAERSNAVRGSAPAAVVSVDLDGLEQTNDTHGHDAGDAVLRRAARAAR
jgi:diguanylate cyclase (GGDEF)-like protein